MEGFPLSGYATSYLNYNNDSTCSTDTVDTIMNRFAQVEVETPWSPMITMKEELINLMKAPIEPITETETEPTNEITTSEPDMLNTISDTIIQFMKAFKEQLDKMNVAERAMKQSIQDNQKDIQMITTFIEFLGKIKDQTDKDIQPLQEQMNVICNDIQSTSTLKDIKDNYIREKKLFHKYLNIIKLVNQMNVGSTCTICLQENVNSYFNPCGHTACASCCEKNSNYNGSCCPLCRSVIHRIHKLYFS
jgi:hypothetical protein